MEPPAASSACRIPFQEDGRLPAPQRDALFVCSLSSCPEGWTEGYSPPMRPAWLCRAPRAAGGSQRVFRPVPCLFPLSLKTSSHVTPPPHPEHKFLLKSWGILKSLITYEVTDHSTLEFLLYQVLTLHLLLGHGKVLGVTGEGSRVHRASQALRIVTIPIF